MEQQILITVEDVSKQNTEESGNSGDTLAPLPPTQKPIDTKWQNHSSQQLSDLPLSTVQSLKKEIDDIIQERSGELVVLLQDRHRMQDEVDVRSITIEQLLKFAEKRQLQLGDPVLSIQMSAWRESECGGPQSVTVNSSGSLNTIG